MVMRVDDHLLLSATAHLAWPEAEVDCEERVKLVRAEPKNQRCYLVKLNNCRFSAGSAFSCTSLIVPRTKRQDDAADGVRPEHLRVLVPSTTTTCTSPPSLRFTTAQKYLRHPRSPSISLDTHRSRLHFLLKDEQ